MSKPKLSMGDIILTNKDEFMLIVGGKKENDTWLYYCRERLNGGDTTEHFVREHEVKAVVRDHEWSDIAYLEEA